MPVSIIWVDGRRIEIDEVLDVRQMASLKVGGCGIRYVVRIGTERRNLYLEETRWFVEAPGTECA